MSAHVLDSSGWIECLDGGPNTPHFAPVLRRLPGLIIPAIVLTEVRKVVLKQRTREQADDITRTMRTGEIVSIDEDIALAAADDFVQFSSSSQTPSSAPSAAPAMPPSGPRTNTSRISPT